MSIAERADTRFPSVRFHGNEMYDLDVDCIFTTTEVADRLMEILYRAYFADQRILLTRSGLPVVAVIPAGDLAEYEAFEGFYWGHVLEQARLEDDGLPEIPIEQICAELEARLDRERESDQ